MTDLKPLVCIIMLSLGLCACNSDEADLNGIPEQYYPQEIISEIDGAKMRLIPAGEFEMGDHLNIGEDDERPVHTVYHDAFYMEIYEVTNARYKKFLDATGHKPPALFDDPRFNKPDHPVVQVGWHDAVAYTRWAGKSLPTEAQWEYVAHGGLVGKRYPWGDTITRDDANYGGTGGRDEWKYTSPIGRFAPNGFGLYDILGNVWEWCIDEYDKDFYAKSPRENPVFGKQTIPAGVETFRTLRGGGWGGNPTDFRVADRWYHLSSESSIGFRCVQSVVRK